MPRSESVPKRPSNAALILAVVALTAMAFAAGLLTGRYALPHHAPVSHFRDEALRDQARARAEFLKGSNQLRGVAMATLWLAANSPEADIPADDPIALLQRLAEHDAIPADFIQSWPTSGDRPTPEPPFYILTDPNMIDPKAPAIPLLAAHPANHPEIGGAIVWTDTRAELIEDPDAYRLRFDELISAAAASRDQQDRGR